MKKVKIFFISVLLIVVIGVGIVIGLSYYRVDSSKYTEAQHLQRISQRIRTSYIGKDYGFTDFNVYPLYNEQEEMKHCLVEFEPSGFFCVGINEKSSVLPWYKGMYTLDQRCLSNPTNFLNDNWQRVRYPATLEGVELYPESQWKMEQYFDSHKVYEVDLNGEYIYYNQSPFKVANVLEERKYCLNKSGFCYFAVKQDDDYFNLVSMDKMKEEGYDGSISTIIFYDPLFNL